MKVLVAVEDEQFLGELSSFLASYPWPKDSEFHVLHVVLPVKVGSFMSVLPSPLLENIAKEREKAGQLLVEQVRNAIDSVQNNSKITVEVCDGLPKEEILDRASKLDSSLIVMGSHRRSVSDLMIGNVTQAVVSNAPCCVLVIPLPNKKHSDKGGGKEPHKVV
ncbi:MAG TPA: universal stress protein [Candidatus Melainabacteria bacterium]|nr:universal stress protein [Candidatus Melainabacteria bacterium]